MQLTKTVLISFNHPRSRPPRRRSALHFAASGGNTDAVRLLIENWANLNPYDGYGGTPLADSIREGHIETQMVLRDKGAKLKEKGLCTAAAAGGEGA